MKHIKSILFLFIFLLFSGISFAVTSAIIGAGGGTITINNYYNITNVTGGNITGNGTTNSIPFWFNSSVLYGSRFTINNLNTSSELDAYYAAKSTRINVTGPLFINGGANAVIDSGFALSIAQANSVTGGFLTANDWDTFNNKANFSYVTSLGNWSADKVNYATLIYVNNINNLSYSLIASNIGNWTQDKQSYYTNLTAQNDYVNITTAQSSINSLVVNLTAQNGYNNITNLQTDRTQLNLTKFNVSGGNITGNITVTGVNIYGNMTIGGTVGQILFGNGGGYSWNSTDSCLVSPANSTNSRQILCVTKPTG